MRRFTGSLIVLFLLAAAPFSTHGQSGSFGTSIVLEDGELIAGEPNTNFREGSVYVFRGSADGWTQVQRLTAPDAKRADGFGTVLARTDGTLFVGQKNGPVHIFENGGGGWQAAGTLTGEGTSGVDPGCGQYGYCQTDFGIALAADGNWLFVGAPGALPQRRRRGEEPPAQEPGIVHVYHRDADGVWNEHSTLAPTGGTDGDRFGATIHLSNGSALIGAPMWNDAADSLDQVGRVTRFDLRGDEWVEIETLDVPSSPAAHIGSAIAVRGAELFVGAPGWNESQGAVLRFRRTQAGWTHAGNISLGSGQTGDRFGSGIGFSDGDLWIGAPAMREYETGSVYVYEAQPDGSLSYSPRRLRLEDTVERDAFGHHIVADGSTVAVVAPGMHHQSGSIHVYSEATPEGQMLVTPPDAIGAITGERRECVDGKIGPFDCSEVDLLSFVPTSILRAPEHARGVRTNDNWGWTDPQTGREYALVGRNDGTSFIDITDPSNPVLIGDLPKPWGTPPSQLWRDIKTYRNHAYIVADGAGDHGMQIFDLTRLRDVQNPPELFEPDVHYREIASSHNVIINEDTGYAYAVDRQTCGGGLYIMNIQEPLNPVFEGCVKGERGTHDSQ
ncbi:MAG: choice-of-anchor B family protein, partial [Rhodothermales bacterium]|nr:choice-of-anchor B family protein [Rhodothermales bacterium]